jgi:hypothetical protein
VNAGCKRFCERFQHHDDKNLGGRARRIRRLRNQLKGATPMTIGKHDAFESRRLSFEEAYFRNKDAELVEKLRRVFQAKVDREELSRRAGITNKDVLDRLMTVQVRGEMLTAFKLLPLVEIAWADGACDKREADAVVAAAIEHGISPDSLALQRVKDWLERGPNPDARKAWYMYAQELRNVLSPDELKTFREDLVQAAQRIAELSGGILMTFFTVSRGENTVLTKMTDALSNNHDSSDALCTQRPGGSSAFYKG